MSTDLLLQIIITSIAATSAMTLFSYAVSASAQDLYKEPVLLVYIQDKLHVELSKRQKNILGWLLHYFIGFCFVLGYHYLWICSIVEKSWITALLLGIISGLIGVLGWIVLFKITSQKPVINFEVYYIQLFIAHIIFALAAFGVYNLF